MEANSNTRDQVSALLSQIANLVGVQSPSNTSPSHITGNGPNSSRTFLNGGYPAGSSTPIPSSSNSSIISELRNRFAPYNQTARVRLAERSALSRRINVSQSRTWCGRFLCLSTPTNSTTLRPQQRQNLSEVGLGDSMVSTSTTANSEEVRNAILEAYPRLRGTDFELLRPLSGGIGRGLIRISTTESVPPVSFLKAARVSVIYVRPLQEIVVEDETPADSPSVPSVTLTPDVTTTIQGQTDNNNIEYSTFQDPSAVAGTTAVHRALEEYQTLEEYKFQVYEENPGEQMIVLSRDNFLERVFGVYKNPGFNYLKKPKIEFNGEAGADLGALSREYFWKGLVALSKDKFDGKYLFEGMPDHQLPSIDSRLLRSGVYKAVGQFMAHSILHCGYGFVGLSEAAAEYLTTSEVDSDTPFTITVEDIPDADVREVIMLIQSLESGATLDHSNKTKIQEVCLSSDFNEVISRDNARLAVEHLLYHHVIEKRKSYLDAIKTSLRNIGILKFLSNKPYIRSGIFPRMALASYPANVVIDRININGKAEIGEYVKAYIRQISNEPEKIQRMLQAWTGWPIIPDGGLEIEVQDDIEFKANTCFNQISIPSNFTEKDVNEMFELLISVGVEGFGSI